MKPTILTAIFVLVFLTGISSAGTYADERRGFSFGYPAGYAIDAPHGGHYFYLKNTDGKKTLMGQIEDLSEYPREIYRELKTQFRDFGVDRALLRCGADGPDGSAYCPAVNSEREFTTANGVRAIELYLDHVQEFYGEKPGKTKTVTGPVYLVDLSRGGSPVVLVIGTVPYKQMDKEQKELAGFIIDAMMSGD